MIRSALTKGWWCAGHEVDSNYFFLNPEQQQQQQQLTREHKSQSQCLSVGTTESGYGSQDVFDRSSSLGGDKSLDRSLQFGSRSVSPCNLSKGVYTLFLFGPTDLWEVGPID